MKIIKNQDLLKAFISFGWSLLFLLCFMGFGLLANWLTDIPAERGFFDFLSIFVSFNIALVSFFLTIANIVGMGWHLWCYLTKDMIF